MMDRRNFLKRAGEACAFAMMLKFGPAPEEEPISATDLGHSDLLYRVKYGVPFDSRCRWKLKSKECGYKGMARSCDKTFADCAERGNEVRFGGFSGFPTTRFNVFDGDRLIGIKPLEGRG